MQADFAPIGQLQTSHSGDNSFWPSFTDIMIVITMIFLMATSLLVVRNWRLVAELRESIVAEQLAAQIIESTSQENVTLEERLANVEQSNSILRLRLLKKDEELLIASNTIQQQAASIGALEASNTEFRNTLDLANAALTVANLEIERVATQYRDLENQVARLSAQLNQQTSDNQKTMALLSNAKAEIESLTQTSQAQQRHRARGGYRRRVPADDNGWRRRIVVDDDPDIPPDTEAVAEGARALSDVRVQITEQEYRGACDLDILGDVGHIQRADGGAEGDVGPIAEVGEVEQDRVVECWMQAGAHDVPRE